jgi:hypothetical protein
MSKTRISTDLGNPQILRMLKTEAQLKDCTVKEVLITALEAYFSHQLETRALQKASETVFEGWNNPKDSDYDKL